MSRTGINKKEALQLLKKLAKEKTAFNFTSYYKYMGRFGEYRSFKLKFFNEEKQREETIYIDGRCNNAVQKFICDLIGREFFSADQNIFLEYKPEVEAPEPAELPEPEASELEEILKTSANLEQLDIWNLKALRSDILNLKEKLKNKDFKVYSEVLQEIVIDTNKRIREIKNNQKEGSENDK